jgi:prepilin-type N-terminal cleavage/methylation domain-containing protein
MKRIHSRQGRPALARCENFKDCKRNGRHVSGFTLTELLVVLGIIAAVTALSGQALRSLNTAGSTSQAASDLAGLLEYSRTYAMTHRTYVRVGFGANASGQTVILPIYAADGSLDYAMSDLSQWLVMRKALVLQNLGVNDKLDSTGTVKTLGDGVPSQTNISSFTRSVGGAATSVQFASIIQFNPRGEAQIEDGKTARFIKIGLQRPSTPDSNPVIVRVSGTTGNIHVLRKEDGI